MVSPRVAEIQIRCEKSGVNTNPSTVYTNPLRMSEVVRFKGQMTNGSIVVLEVDVQVPVQKKNRKGSITYPAPPLLGTV